MATNSSKVKISMFLIFLIAVLACAGCAKQTTTVHISSVDSEQSNKHSQPLSVDEREAPDRAFRAISAPIIAYYGPISLEQRISEADIIARVKLHSVSSEVDIAAYKPDDLSDTDFSGVLEFNFHVLEYLLGSGSSEIVAVGVEPWAFDTYEEAQSILPDIMASRDNRWDNREAIVFLQDSNEILPSTKQVGRYYLGFLTLGSDDGYTVSSPHSKLWLPAAQTDDVFVTSDKGSQQFLTSALSAKEDGEGMSSASGQYNGYGTTTLAELKARIVEIQKEIKAGDGSDEYRKCVLDKYRTESVYRWKFQQEGGSGVKDKRSLVSGLTAGTLIYEDGEGDGELPNKTGRYWLEGQSKELFNVEAHNIKPYDWSGNGINDRIMYTRRITSMRPLPEGEYDFYFEGIWSGLIVCNGYPESLRNYYEFIVSVTAPAGALHEAFFDPVALGDAVGADGASGVLKPAAFAFDGNDAAIRRIDWLDGQARMSLSPLAALPGHHIDFIALDGSVTLRLDFDDAMEVADDEGVATFVWGVCSQPWADGDLLMLRISESPADLAGATFNADCAPSETPVSPTATPEVTPTETPVPTPTAAPMLTLIPTISSISTPKAAPTPEQADTVTPTPTP